MYLFKLFNSHPRKYGAVSLWAFYDDAVLESPQCLQHLILNIDYTYIKCHNHLINRIYILSMIDLLTPGQNLEHSFKLNILNYNSI